MSLEPLTKRRKNLKSTVKTIEKPLKTLAFEPETPLQPQNPTPSSVFYKRLSPTFTQKPNPTPLAPSEKPIFIANWLKKPLNSTQKNHRKKKKNI